MSEFQLIETTLANLDKYDDMAKEAKCRIEKIEEQIPITHNYYKNDNLIVSVKAFSECP